MIRCQLFTTSWQTVPAEQGLAQWRSDTGSTLWLDICGESDDVVRDWLGAKLDLHSLAIDDALHPRHPPKSEVFGGVVLLIAKGLADSATASNADNHFQTNQLVLFVGERLLVTYGKVAHDSVAHVWATEGHTAQPMRLAGAILRQLVDKYTPVFMKLEERLEQLEGAMFVSQDDALLEELVGTNTLLKKMRRTLSYHCDALSELKTLAAVSSDKEAKHGIADVLDHFKRLNSMSQLFQELTVDLVNGYLSLSSHRLNKVMKVLTVFTVIFLPLTLVVGIYGMNFDHMPELHWHYGYPLVMGAMVGIVLLALALFKRLRWL